MSLLLLARLAAARLVPVVRGVSRHRPIWMPIALRWKRHRVRLAKTRKPAAVLQGSFVLRLEFHLHVATAPRTGSRRAAPNIVELAPRGREPRWEMRQRIRPIARASVPPRPLPGRPPRAVPMAGSRASVARPHPVSGSADRPRSPRRPVSMVVPMLASRPAFAAERIADSRHLEPARTRHAPSTYRGTVTLAGKQSPHYRQVSKDLARAESRLRISGAPEDRSRRTPDLVWSKSPRSPASASVSESRYAIPSARRPDTYLPAAVPEASAPSLARASAVPAMTLDPALVDRLADDVIRRVERRVRIERERRGI